LFALEYNGLSHYPTHCHHPDDNTLLNLTTQSGCTGFFHSIGAATGVVCGGRMYNCWNSQPNFDSIQLTFVSGVQSIGIDVDNDGIWYAHADVGDVCTKTTLVAAYVQLNRYESH
jgi:hypothetical protein